MRGKIIFSPLWFLIQKLDPISGLHAKIREKSLVIKSEGFFGLLEGENAGKGEEMVSEEGEMDYRVQN